MAFYNSYIEIYSHLQCLVNYFRYFDLTYEYHVHVIQPFHFKTITSMRFQAILIATVHISLYNS